MSKASYGPVEFFLNVMAMDREILTFTVTSRMFQDMEAGVEGSFLETVAWQKLKERK